MMLSAEAQAAIAAFEEVRQRVAALNDHLQAANAAIRLVKEQAAAGNRPALAADLAQLNAVKARHSAEIALRCAAYLEEKLAKAATEVRRNAAREALEDYRRAVFPNYEVAINLRSEEHTSELQSLMRTSYAVFCLQNKK